MCKLAFARNIYMRKPILLAIGFFLSAMQISSFSYAQDKWVVSDTSKPNAQESAVTAQQIVEVENVSGGIKLYNFSSRRLVTSISKATQFNVTGGNKTWVYVSLSGYPVWVHSNYVERDQGRIKVVIQEGKLNLRKGPDKYAMTLGTVENGYSSIELDYKDPWVKIVAPDTLAFAIKRSDFNKLNKDNVKVAKSNTEATISTTNNSSSEKKSNTIVSADNYEKRSEIKTQPKEKELSAVKTAKETAAVEQKQSFAFKQPQPDRTKPDITKNTASVNSGKIPYTDALIYRLTPGDVISIQIYGESELGVNQVRIPEGGVISFPLIGQIKVAGKTAAAVENLVTRKLADGYIRNPRVSLIIDNYRPIYIRGAVSNAGAFPYTEGLTIAQAITLAGGATRAANFNGVALVRRNVAIDAQLSIDSQTLVQPGDIISIAEEIGGASADAVEFVYLHGEVKSPGGYDYRKGLTVEKAVALAGGFSARASKRRINISREVPGQEEPVKLKKVDLYFPVQPGDVISVGASWF